MTSRLVAHYVRLGLTPPATRAELAAAYRRAALKHHPDRGGSALDFAAITDSYNVLLRQHTPTVYDPASLRTYRSSVRHSHDSPLRGLASAVVLPCVIGLAVGLRLLYVQPERDELRAGGTSRFTEPERR